MDLFLKNPYSLRTIPVRSPLSPAVDTIKHFGGNLNSTSEIVKVFLIADPAHKCENNAILKQNYSLKRFIAFKMAHSSCFSLGRNLDFLQKSFRISEATETAFEIWAYPGLFFVYFLILY